MTLMLLIIDIYYTGYKETLTQEDKQSENLTFCGIMFYLVVLHLFVLL